MIGQLRMSHVNYSPNWKRFSGCRWDLRSALLAASELYCFGLGSDMFSKSKESIGC